MSYRGLSRASAKLLLVVFSSLDNRPTLLRNVSRERSIIVLSVLATYFDYRIRQDQDSKQSAWHRRDNPVSMPAQAPRHGMIGRDAPPRERTGEFRRRVPRKIPKALDPDTAQQLIASAVS